MTVDPPSRPRRPRRPSPPACGVSVGAGVSTGVDPGDGLVDGPRLGLLPPPVVATPIPTRRRTPALSAMSAT